jgi:hypothetical protein
LRLTSQITEPGLPLPPETPALLQTMWTLPVSSQRLLRQVLYGFSFRDIRQHADDVVLRVMHLLHCDLQRSGFDVRQDHLHPFLREAFSHRASHAAGRTRDDRHLAVKILHLNPWLALVLRACRSCPPAPDLNLSLHPCRFSPAGR